MNSESNNLMEASPRERPYNVLPDLLSHIDTEIAMRTRLEQTLQARIEWAMALQATLRNGKKGEFPGHVNHQDFEKLAGETLVAAELPSSVLFATAPSPNTPLSTKSSTSDPPPFRRPLPRAKPIGYSRTKGSFLFVNALNVSGYTPSPTSTPSEYLLLKCPTCGRMAFSSLQGLLNHVRISHSVEYGTHDACIQACAVEEPNMDLNEGIEVGLGPSGILPGLQTLFERAVGVQPSPSSSTPSGTLPKQESAEGAIGVERVAGSRLAEPDPSSVSASQSLGIHEETAALAPFLGKEAKRRQIRVFDENMDVDIGTMAPTVEAPRRAPASNHRWRMTFAHRNTASTDADATSIGAEVEESELEAKLASAAQESKAGTNVGHPSLSSSPRQTLESLPSTGSSRFHFAVRVSITDRNLFIPPEKREKSSHSHKWMVGAESPSYSLPLSRVLKYIRVTPLCDSEDCDVSVSVAETPPYAVVGTASKPFLARIELVFNDVVLPNIENLKGDGANRPEQTMVLEHWVELDPLKAATIVLGEEQLVDAELDRRTELRPAITDYLPLESRKLWEDRTPGTQRLHPPPADADAGGTTSLALSILVELAKRYPLTLQVCTAKDRNRVEAIPYKLASSQEQFSKFVLGRQNAIKWARARTIKTAFNEALRERGIELTCAPITAAEVYLWIQEADKGHKGEVPFEKGKASATSKGPGGDAGGRGSYCGFCGLEAALHAVANGSVEDSQGCKEQIQEVAEPQSNGLCNLYTAISSSLAAVSVPHPTPIPSDPLSDRTLRHSTAHTSTAERWLVEAVDPELTLFVKRIIAKRRLATFPSSKDHSCGFGSGSDDQDHIYAEQRLQSLPERAELDAHLAPHALIGLALQHFVRGLVQHGVSQALKEKMTAMRRQQAATGRRGTRGAAVGLPTSMLTPHHILEGNGVADSLLRHTRGSMTQ